MEAAELLRALMARADIGPKELAQKTGISESALHAYRAGRSHPSARSAWKLAVALPGGDDLLRAYGYEHLIPETLEEAMPPPTAQAVQYVAPPSAVRPPVAGESFEVTVLAVYDSKLLLRSTNGMTYLAEGIVRLSWASWADTQK